MCTGDKYNWKELICSNIILSQKVVQEDFCSFNSTCQTRLHNDHTCTQIHADTWRNSGMLFSSPPTWLCGSWKIKSRWFAQCGCIHLNVSEVGEHEMFDFVWSTGHKFTGQCAFQFNVYSAFWIIQFQLIQSLVWLVSVWDWTWEKASLLGE